MITRLAWFMIWVLLSGCAAGLGQQPPPGGLEQEFLSTNFLIQTRTGSINRQVMALLGSMADPGETYNHTDAVNLKLPMRELIFAGEGPDMAFIFYNQGGIALTKQVFLARLNDNGDVVQACRYRLEGAGAYKDEQELKKDFPAGFQKESCLK